MKRTYIFAMNLWRVRPTAALETRGVEIGAVTRATRPMPLRRDQRRCFGKLARSKTRSSLPRRRSAMASWTTTRPWA